MQIFRDPGEFQEDLDRRRREGHTIGMVPTMGALHEGHLSLCRQAASDTSLAAASIFVNPLQFGPAEDFSSYPRQFDSDARALEAAGVQIIFAPQPDAIYPCGFQTHVDVDEISRTLEGEWRPGHFRGVATVVLKLFNLAGRCSAYFGEKDFQQLQLIRRMVRDLNVPVRVIGMPTVREPDGLAMSSRNRYLSPEERRAAPAIYSALEVGRRQAQCGVREAAAIVYAVKAAMSAEPLVKPEYVAVVDADTFVPLERLQGKARLLTAVRLPSARLIDNVPLP